MRLVRSAAAVADVDAIWREIAAHNITAADRMIDRITDAADRLRDFPHSGRDRSALRRGLRSVLARPYVIFYRITDNRIEIARVVHGARDLPAVAGMD